MAVFLLFSCIANLDCLVDFGDAGAELAEDLHGEVHALAYLVEAQTLVYER